MSAITFNNSNSPSEYSTQSSQDISLNTQESPARSQVLSTPTSSPFQSPSRPVDEEDAEGEDDAGIPVEEEEDGVRIHRSNYLWFRGQDLPEVGTRFDVTVTQVDQPDIVYIQRYPPSLDDPLFADDANDATAPNAYTELKELEDVSGLINCEGYYEGKSLNVKPTIGKINRFLEFSYDVITFYVSHHGNCKCRSVEAGLKGFLK